MASLPNIFESSARAERETTAGEARAEATTARTAHQVEVNANLEQQAAEQAASVAKSKGRRLTGEMETPAEEIQNTSKQTLDKAVEEGKRDVADIQAAAAGKLGQAKEMGAKATSTVKEYIVPQAGQSKESGGIMSSQVQGSSVLDTASGALASAKASATGALGAVGSTAQNILGTAGTQGAQVKDMPSSSSGIPALSAPLESGAKKLDTTYPSQGVRDVAQNEHQ